MDLDLPYSIRLTGRNIPASMSSPDSKYPDGYLRTYDEVHRELSNLASPFGKTLAPHEFSFVVGWNDGTLLKHEITKNNIPLGEVLGRKVERCEVPEKGKTKRELREAAIEELRLSNPEASEELKELHTKMQTLKGQKNKKKRNAINKKIKQLEKDLGLDF